jgi:hypothetical protein
MSHYSLLSGLEWARHVHSDPRALDLDPLDYEMLKLCDEYP